MKIPDIDYATPVQQSSGAIAQVDQARRQSLDVISAGFQALGQEMIKSQSQKAAADVEEGMAQLEADLNSKRYVSAQEVRDKLGNDFQQLPSNVREQLTKKTIDPSTGREVTLDREDVPTWVVAGALYDKRSKDLVRAASEQITAPGWQAEFQRAALEDVTKRKASFNSAQMHAMLADQKQVQAATVDQLVRLGSFEQALATIDRSEAFHPGEKAQLVESVLAAKQKADVATAKLAQAAQVEATSSTILQAAQIPGYGWVDPAKALAAVDALPNTDPTKDDVRKLVEHQVEQAERLRKVAGEDALNRARSMLNQGVPLQGAQLAGLKAWMLDAPNGAAGLWDSLERNVEAEARARRVERNDREERARRVKADATREEREAERARKDAAKEEADKQKAYDADAVTAFNDLELGGKPGEDQATVDLRARYPDLSPTALGRLQGLQKKSAKEWNKDQGVSLGAFKAAVEETGRQLGYGEKTRADFLSYMRDQYDAWGMANPGKTPASVDVNKMLAEAVIYGDVSMGYDKETWRLRREGKTAAPAKDQAEVQSVLDRLGGSAPASGGPAHIAGVADWELRDVKAELRAKGLPPDEKNIATSLARRSFVPPADEQRIQAEWKRRFPDRPPLRADQIRRVLADEKRAGK